MGQTGAKSRAFASFHAEEAGNPCGNERTNMGKEWGKVAPETSFFNVLAQKPLKKNFEPAEVGSIFDSGKRFRSSSKGVGTHATLSLSSGLSPDVVVVELIRPRSFRKT